MKNYCFIVLVIVSYLISNSQEIRYEDKIRIAEAQKIAKKYGNKIWKDIEHTPFILLLVTDEYEYLINHDTPTNDFKFLVKDSILKSKIYYRKTKLNKHLLATFPAVNGKNCIVVGTPENTNKNTSDWIITLLHEHFHQYTYNSLNYFSDVEKLDLSNGDTSGVWMINYPFPYDDIKINEAYKKYNKILQKLVKKIKIISIRMT